ncbi:hypothetical protein M8J76_006018 [Diaphorina citri]|nr:hypothetical protein M8J76_006018 [Diaphorina citri]
MRVKEFALLRMSLVKRSGQSSSRDGEMEITPVKSPIPIRSKGLSQKAVVSLLSMSLTISLLVLLLFSLYLK